MAKTPEEIDRFLMVCARSDIEELKKIINEGEMEQYGTHLYSALLDAIKGGDLLLVNELLTIKAVQEQAASAQNLALRTAQEKGFNEIATSLLQVEKVKKVEESKKGFFPSAERMHPKVEETDIPLPEERPGQIISRKAYNYVKKRQLKEKDSLKGKFIMPDKNNDLAWPVFIGEKGEPIAIYQRNMLGKGGFGKVYLGFNLDTGKIHAVKLQSLEKEGSKALIEEEEQVLEDLGLLIDRMEGEIDNQYVSVGAQELAWGDKVTTYLKKEKKSEVTDQSDVEKLEIAIELLQKISTLHKKGYLHRDIKNDNAVWDKEKKNLTLVDHGLAKKMDKNHEVKEKPKEVEPEKGKRRGKKKQEQEFIMPMGTRHCVAPELLQEAVDENTCTYSPKTDMYAAAVSITELFTENDLGLNDKEYFNQMYKIIEEKLAMPPLLEEKARDIFKQEPSMGDPNRALKMEMYQCLREMMHTDPEMRLDFDEAIKRLTEIKNKMAKNVIKKEKDVATQGPIPSENETATKERSNLNKLKLAVNEEFDFENALMEHVQEKDTEMAQEENEQEAQEKFDLNSVKTDIDDEFDFMQEEGTEIETEQEEAGIFQEFNPENVLSLDEFLENHDYPPPLALTPVVESLPETKKETKNEEDAVRESLEAIASKLEEYVNRLSNEIQQVQSKHMGATLHKRDALSNKRNALYEAENLLKQVQLCKDMHPLNRNGLLDIGFNVLNMRGKHYCRNLKSASDTERGTQFGSEKEFSQILKDVQSNIIPHLGGSKLYLKMASDVDQKENKHRPN